MLVDTATMPELRGRLPGLRDVLIPDGWAFKLARALAGFYAGTGTQRAHGRRRAHRSYGG
jgi:hypothetical protein